jgi:hypothetical protein
MLRRGTMARNYLAKCPCGSGAEAFAEYDARGIFLCFACGRCRKHKLAGYRSEVLTDSQYEADEEIEPEEGVIPDEEPW